MLLAVSPIILKYFESVLRVHPCSSINLRIWSCLISRTVSRHVLPLPMICKAPDAPGSDGSGPSASALIVLLLILMPFLAGAKDGINPMLGAVVKYQLKHLKLKTDSKDSI